MTELYFLVYRILRAAGLTHEAALAMMGNWEKESLFTPCRKQGDLSDAALPSQQYTAAVTSGAISREQFARDQIGYGLAQWTYFNFTTGKGRKLNLYDFWKRSGKALDDPTMQTDFAVWELKNEFSGVYAELKKSDNLYYCTDLICKRFEMPDFNNVNDRFEAAKQIAAILAKEADEEDDPDQPETPFWPPRGAKGGKDDPGLCKGMNGPDVEALQGLLNAHGYTYGSTKGVFGDSTDRAVRKFQQDNKLAVDGIAGPMTWAAITRF